jgi:hypothetical protein
LWTCFSPVTLEEKRFDGIFLLRTNIDLNALQAMPASSSSGTPEQTFRTAKHLFWTRRSFTSSTRPSAATCSAASSPWLLKKALEDRIAALGLSGSWPEIIADLDSLSETEIGEDGKRFIVSSAPRPLASLAIRAAGVALPPGVRRGLSLIPGAENVVPSGPRGADCYCRPITW